MKLATYCDGSRDGQLLLVSRDLTTAHYATGIANRLQQALDDWNFIAPQLQDLYTALNSGKARHAFAFDPARCMAPLPRAYQWIVAAAPTTTTPAAAPTTAPHAPPSLHQGASDDFAGPRKPITGLHAGPDTPSNLSFDAGLAAITGEVPQAATAEQGLDAVRLLMLFGRTHWPTSQDESKALACQRWPHTAWAPVAVTPDELGPAWHDPQASLHLRLQGPARPAAPAAPFSPPLGLGALIAQAAHGRRLRAGSVLGCVVQSGAWAMPATALAPLPANDPGSHTPVLRIDLPGPHGEPLFGAIHTVLAATGASPDMPD